VTPSRCGEEYAYEVDKYWVVEQVLDEGVVARTRRGKRHFIGLRDPRLRGARWWERLVFRTRFPRLAESPSDPDISRI